MNRRRLSVFVVAAVVISVVFGLVAPGQSEACLDCSDCKCVFLLCFCFPASEGRCDCQEFMMGCETSGAFCSWITVTP